MISFPNIAAFLGIAVSFTPAPALAEWVSIGTSDDGVVTSFVETDSINRSGRYVSFLQKNFLSIPNNGASVTLAHSSINCVSGELYMHHLYGLTKSGRVIHDYEVNNPEPQPILPGSVGGAVYEFVCYKY